MDEGLVLLIVVLLIVLEGLYIAFLPKNAKRIMIDISRNLNGLRLIGVIEIIIGLILFGVAIF